MNAKIESKVQGRGLPSALKGWRSVRQQQPFSAHATRACKRLGHAAAAHLVALDVVQWHLSPMPPQGSQSKQNQTSNATNQGLRTWPPSM